MKNSTKSEEDQTGGACITIGQNMESIQNVIKIRNRERGRSGSIWNDNTKVDVNARLFEVHSEFNWHRKLVSNGKPSGI
jgi:hypothetical protein